jgi:hypothetical protein
MQSSRESTGERFSKRLESTDMQGRSLQMGSKKQGSAWAVLGALIVLTIAAEVSPVGVACAYVSACYATTYNGQPEN